MNGILASITDMASPIQVVLTSGVPTQTLSAIGNWLRIVNVFQKSSGAAAAYGTVRDPQSGVVMPLRTGAYLKLRDGKLFDRLEFNLGAGAASCTVEAIAGIGDCDMALRPVIALPFAGELIGTVSTFTMTGSSVPVLASSPEVVRVMIGTAIGNLGSVSLILNSAGGTTPSRIMTPGDNWEWTLGCPDIAAIGTATDVLWLTTFRLSDAYGATPP